MSPEEVSQLIDSASNLFHRTMLMTLYSAGIRRAELCRLQVADIDSQRMMVHIRQGEDGYDRSIPLSEKLLEQLRTLLALDEAEELSVSRHGEELASGRSRHYQGSLGKLANRQRSKRAGITKPHLATTYYDTVTPRTCSEASASLRTHPGCCSIIARLNTPSSISASFAGST